MIRNLHHIDGRPKISKIKGVAHRTNFLDRVRGLWKADSEGARRGLISSRVGVPAIRRYVHALRQDNLHRTSALLIGDGLLLGGLGALFLLIATHVWDPRSIGTVSAIYGATGLIQAVALLGMPAMIVANLAKEPDQALMVRGALVASTSVGVILLAGLWLIPNHLGVPFSKLGVSTPIAVVLSAVLVLASISGSIVDQAFLARQEVSWTLGKDMTAVVIRFVALAILAGTVAAGYLGVAVIYSGSAAAIDLALLRWRVRRLPRERVSLGLRQVRPHVKLAAGYQVAVLASLIPSSLLPLIVLSRLGAAAAAYTAIPLTFVGVLNIVPSMTAQSLFAEISAHPEELMKPIGKALRASYAITVPLAVFVIVLGPRLLQLFGHGYSVHGSDLVRWGAASSFFFCLNYVSDYVLLARKLVTAYVFANVVGSACVLVSILIAVNHGLSGLGLGLFIGQVLYCGVSCATLAWYVGRKNLPSALRELRR